MVNLCGESSSRLLFTDGRNAVSIDKITNIVEDVADIAVLSAYPEWREPDSEPTQAQIDLATGALADLEIHVVTAAGRMYTIPKGAQAEAKKALEWRKEHKRGGTPVGLNTARTLARGGQIGIEKIRHIAKYFPRHEVDKKGKGWKPGQDNFPSNGRIAWALWGGDVAWRWAQAIVERENKRKKSMSAGGFIDDYETPGHNADLNAFKLAYEMGEENAPEFVARVGADENIDRLYKIDLDGTVFVWDDGGWDSLGHVDHDISTMDRALDDPYDTADKRHILIDADSAFIISAHLQAKPFSSISVYDLDEEEAALVLAAADDIDWVAADYALAAAGDAPEGAVEAGDGQYTPKERSEKARRQVRDKTGRFAQSGSRVVIGGDASKSGVITALRPDTDSVIVKMDSGESIEVAGTDTQRADSVQPMASGPGIGDSELDTSGILAQPRAPMDKPDAYIPGGLPGLTSKDLETVISNFPAWVQSQRGAQKPAAPTSEFKPKDPGYNKKPAEADDFQKNIESLRGRPIYDDAHQHPMLKDFFKKKKNEVWFNPITSAAEQGKEKEDDTVEELTPENSDVQPMYMAIVSPDDPRAVFDLIAIVPASKKSNTPMTYVRKEGKWSRDEKILADLKSATPPPVVPLHGDVYKDVLSQVDGGVRSSGELLLAAGILVAEEKDLADALIEIVAKHGKFNEDETGVWAGYVSAADNEVKNIGVTCANCVLYEGGTSCKIIANEVEPQARCRFAVIPDGVVNPTTSSALVAAKGGIDKNRGKAEKLRRYWVYGRGAAKIKWGLPGDWSRCVRHLSKYMGPRAKGYCNLRHKDALKIYPATHAKILHGGRKRGSVEELGLAELIDHEDVLMMEEPLYEIYGAKKTKKPKLVITDADLAMDIEELENQEDPLYDSEWQPDQEMLEIINELGELLDDDSLVAGALLAKGGLDRNRGKAEKLRRYWLYGKGALKIRWNTPGDWTRCFRHLAKYMGPRAKGYCALRHKEATGMWTGDTLHRKLYGHKGSRNFSINDVVSSEDYYMRASLSAHAEAAREKMRSLTATGAYEINDNTVEQGSKFSIPLVIPEGVESGDGRKFKKDAISLRELPLPLLWQIKTADGHNGSVVVGRIDHMERTEDGIGNATGVFDTGAYGKEAERMVREGFMRGVSADLDMFEASEDQEDAENSGTKEDGKIGGNKLTITQARVMAVTIVPKPAFEQCKIYIEDQASGTQEEETVFQDGEYVEELDITPIEAEAIVACGSIAASVPVVPPATWFTNPNLDKPTPLTVDENGRVFGHIAAWHTDHIGMSHGVRAPRSRTNYAYFHTGVVRTDDNKDVPVGQLTLAGGHAPLEASARDAVKHYDDTASAIADVHAGEDAHGIWVAGALRPGTTPEQVRVFRASAPSGDWRPIKGHLELVAVCQVNVPGFPIARARVASGQVYALVAAGASILAKMKSDPLIELEQRVAALETSGNSALVARATEMREKFTAAKEEVDAELSTRAAAAAARFASIRGIEYDELGYISRETRQKLAAEKKALPDGSFPIRNEGELKDAVQAFGRAKKSKRAAVRRHIMRRARGMGRSDLIPEEWKNLSIADDIDFEIIDDMRSRVASAQAEAEFADISTEARERLAKEGKALPDGSYPIRNASDLENAIKAYGRSKPGDRAKVRRHIMKRARALGKADMIPEKWKSASAMEEDVLDLRARVASAKEGLLAGETETPSSEALLAAPETDAKYVSGVNQPRDAAGKFRQVLARLKGDLGTSGLDDVVKKIEETENLDDAGNYKAAAASAQELLKILDRLDSGSLNPEALENIRSTTRELGSVISNLPLPFGSEAQKVRYSDLPPVLRDLIDGMMDRVEKKIGKEDADVATQKLRQYKAGGDAYSQEEVSSDLSKLLRLLT